MIRLVQFFGLGFLLLMVLNGLSWIIDDTGEHRQMREALPAIQGREAVSLGGSIGVGLRFPEMCVDGADYFWNGQDLFEVEAVADLILDGPAPPRYWFVVAAPTAQSYDNGAQASERGGRRREFHRLLFRHGRFGMVGGDWRQVLITALTPALGYDAWAGRFQMLRHQMGLAEAPPPPTDRAARDRLTLDPARAGPEAEAFTDRQAVQLQRMAYYDSSIPRRSEEALIRINQRIAATGGTMIVVTPPMTEAVRESTMREMGDQVRGFEAMLARLAEDGVVVSNHWRDPAFAESHDLFADNQHLNRAGAQVFSRSLADELRDRDILPAAACSYGQAVETAGFQTTSGHEILDDAR